MGNYIIGTLGPGLTSVLEGRVFPGEAIVGAFENGSIPTALLNDSLIIRDWSYAGWRERGNDSILEVESSLQQTVTGWSTSSLTQTAVTVREGAHGQPTDWEN